MNEHEFSSRSTTRHQPRPGRAHLARRGAHPRPPVAGLAHRTRIQARGPARARKGPGVAQHARLGSAPADRRIVRAPAAGHARGRCGRAHNRRVSPHRAVGARRLSYGPKRRGKRPRAARDARQRGGGGRDGPAVRAPAAAHTRPRCSSALARPVGAARAGEARLFQNKNASHTIS